MGSLTGIIRDRVGGELLNAQAVLVPADPAILVGSEVRLGGVAVTLAADGTFTVPSAPDGTYTLLIHYYDPAADTSRSIAILRTAPFSISGATDLADVL